MTVVASTPRITCANTVSGALGSACVPRISRGHAARSSYSYSSPVLLVAAIPSAVAAVSGLAKRPRSGLALTRWTRPRSSCSEEDEPQLKGRWWGSRADQERCSGWLFGLSARERPLLSVSHPGMWPMCGPRSRLRRPLTRLREFVRSAWSHSVGAVACSEDHSVYLPDHGLLGRQIEPGGHLSDNLRRPATSGVASCPEKRISVRLISDIKSVKWRRR